MLSRRQTFAAAALMASPGAAFAEAAPPKDDGIIRIPVRLVHDQLLVDVWLNGKGPFAFMLDSGSPTYGVDPALIPAAGLQSAYGSNIGGVTGSASVADVWARDVVIGGVLVDHNRVFTPTRGGGLGLLPAQILRLKPCVIDPGEGEIRLYERGAPDLSGYERLTLIPREDPIAPFEGRYGALDAHFVIDVVLDGETLRMAVDTGDQEGVTLFPHTVRRRGLWTRYPRWIAGRAAGIVEATDERLVRGKSLKLGAIEAPDPVIHLVDPERRDGFQDIDGLIGMETLRRFTIGIDAGRGAMWLKPNGALRQAFKYNRSGLSLMTRDRHWVVAAVAAGSPAETAGLAAGDILARAGPDFRWRLQDGPGTVIEFEARRGDAAPRPVRLVLQELI